MGWRVKRIFIENLTERVKGGGKCLKQLNMQDISRKLKLSIVIPWMKVAPQIAILLQFF